MLASLFLYLINKRLSPLVSILPSISGSAQPQGSLSGLYFSHNFSFPWWPGWLCSHALVISLSLGFGDPLVLCTMPPYLIGWTPPSTSVLAASSQPTPGPQQISHWAPALYPHEPFASVSCPQCTFRCRRAPGQMNTFLSGFFDSMLDRFQHSFYLVSPMLHLIFPYYRGCMQGLRSNSMVGWQLPQPGTYWQEAQEEIEYSVHIFSRVCDSTVYGHLFLSKELLICGRKDALYSV